VGGAGLGAPTGRKANAEGLGLEQLGAMITSRGVETDERLRAAENVWAIGDCTTHPQFTHLGKYQARIAAHDIAGRTTKADYRAIPAVAFTDPQIASVGTTEADGLVVGRWNVENTSRASTYEKPKRHGFVKVVADPKEECSSAPSQSGPGPAVVPAADTRDPRGRSRRNPARRDQPSPPSPRASSGRCGSSTSDGGRADAVATDRSQTATRAVAWAAEMARNYGAQLIVVQAFVPGPPPRERSRPRRPRRQMSGRLEGSGDRRRGPRGRDRGRRRRENAGVPSSATSR
jgi:hypothetical protein